MNTYTVTIRGQFVFTTDVDADTPEEAKDQAEIDLDFAADEVESVIINSVSVKIADTAAEQAGESEVNS